MRDSQITTGQRENLETINRSGNHLLALINDVLELSKIEDGQVELQPEAFDWKTMKDLKGIPIGITAKNYYGPAFHEALDAGELVVDEATKDSVQFDKLLRHRIKLHPMNVYTGYYMIRQQYDSQTAALFTHHPRPLKISVYHVLFSRAKKENGARVELFNQGLRKLRASGEYDKIIEEYRKEYNLK